MYCVEILYALSPAEHIYFSTLDRAKKYAKSLAKAEELPMPKSAKACAILIKDKNYKLIERV